MSEPDHIVIEQVLNGQTDQYEVLVLRYQNRLLKFLTYASPQWMDPDDLVQEAFLRAFRKLDQFRCEGNFYSWLVRIAYNQMVTCMRQQKKPPTSLDWIAESSGQTPADGAIDAAPDSQMVQSERVQTIRNALAEIPEMFRIPLLMKEFDDLSYEQIASIHDCPVGTIRSRIFRARQELKTR